VFVGGRRDHLERAALAVQRAVKAAPGLFLHAHGAGGVGLGIEVDQQRVDFLFGQRRGQIDGGGGLADAALLVGDGEYRWWA
jgi:hypothetical protein